MMRKIAFIGVGNMGKGICHNLIEAGNEVSVFDMNRGAMELFKDKAYLAESALNAFSRSDVAFLSLPRTEIVESVVDSFIEQGVAGKLIVDTSTSYPISTRNLYKKVKAAGGALIDAPLIAGPQEAWDATLTIVVAGDKDVVDEYDNMFRSYCKSYDYVGESGNGHLMKLAQNWAGLLQACLYAQLYPVMAKHGIDQKTLYGVLNSEFFDNWFFQFYSKKYIEKNYHMDFALELMLKDLTYMKRLCDELNVPGFMLDGAIDLCRVSLKEGRDRGVKQDCSCVAETMYQYVGID